MKKIYLTLSAFLCFEICSGQAMVGKVEYQKSQQPAAIIELPYPPELVEGALKDYLTKKGSKANQAKGFVAFKNVQVTSGDPVNSDVYFKIDKKSRQEKDVSVVYMMVAKKDENVATRSSIDESGMEQAKNFLNDIGPSIIGYSLELQIKQQEEEVKKAEKKHNNLVEEGQDLDKRKRNIEEKLDQNVKDQENQKLEIERQKQSLEALMAKRKM